MTTAVGSPCPHLPTPTHGGLEGAVDHGGNDYDGANATRPAGHKQARPLMLSKLLKATEKQLASVGVLCSIVALHGWTVEASSTVGAAHVDEALFGRV